MFVCFLTLCVCLDLVFTTLAVVLLSDCLFPHSWITGLFVSTILEYKIVSTILDNRIVCFHSPVLQDCLFPQSWTTELFVSTVLGYRIVRFHNPGPQDCLFPQSWTTGLSVSTILDYMIFNVRVWSSCVRIHTKWTSVCSLTRITSARVCTNLNSGHIQGGYNKNCRQSLYHWILTPDISRGGHSKSFCKRLHQFWLRTLLFRGGYNKNFRLHVSCGDYTPCKLQALVYDILPSTTAVFSYSIGSRKLSANEQFFVGAQTVVSLLQTTQIKQDVSFIAANKVYTSTNKTTINLNCYTTLFFFFLTRVDVSHIYMHALALGCF